MAVTSRMEFIARTQLTGAAASVSFQTGLSGFTKFFFVFYLVNDASAKDVKLRLNNDSGTNYSGQWLMANGATVSGTRTSGVFDHLRLNRSVTLAASSVMLGRMEISKPVAGEVARITMSLSFDGTSPVGILYQPMAAEWSNTADLINRIDVSADAGNYAAGTRILLYGSKD